MAMYAPPGSTQYGETAPKMPGQPGFRPTQPQTDFSKKMPGAPGSSLDNARRAGPMTQGQAIPGMPQQQSGGYSSPPYMPQTQTVPMPQAPAQGFTQQPAQGYTQQGMNPAMMLGPQSPPPAPAAQESTGAVNQPAGPYEARSVTDQYGIAVTPSEMERRRIGQLNYDSLAKKGNNVWDDGPWTDADRQSHAAALKSGTLGQWQDNFSNQRKAAMLRSGYLNPDLTVNAEFQKRLDDSAIPNVYAKMAQQRTARQQQMQQTGSVNPMQNQMAQQRMQIQGQMGAGGMTPLQRSIRDRAAGGGDFVGQFQKPQNFQYQSPLLQQLGV